MFNNFFKNDSQGDGIGNQKEEELHFLSGIPEEDARDEVAKGQDYQASEIMDFSRGALFTEKEPKNWRKFPIRSQNGSGTCVAQTGAKLLGVDNFIEEKKYIEFSALDIYDRRFNKPDSGMAGIDALTIMSKYGACFQNELWDQDITEEQANAPVKRTPDMLRQALKYRGGGYVQIPLNVNAIASFIEQTNKAVMLFVKFDLKEWADVPTVLSDSPMCRHAIPGVDFTLYRGDRCIVIDDSWGKFNAWNGQRLLTEQFIKERVYFAGALLNLKNDDGAVSDIRNKRPHVRFMRPLAFGAVGPDVVALQDMLKFENLFPINTVSTGKFLQITAKAVKAWQIKNGIMDFANQNDMRKISFGPKSIQLANSIYA